MSSDELLLSAHGVDYALRLSPRAKRVRVVVAPGGGVEVVAPARLPRGLVDAHVEKLLKKHGEWIMAAKKRMLRAPVLTQLPRGRKSYLAHKETARSIANDLVRLYSERYGVEVGRLSIRDQKSRWGSCSHAGNLNFNYRIALIPPELARYVVVHEVCHLIQHNHSSRFWALVAREVPDFRAKRAELRGFALG